jgi:hypothetical protein
MAITKTIATASVAPCVVAARSAATQSRRASGWVTCLATDRQMGEADRTVSELGAPFASSSAARGPVNPCAVAPSSSSSRPSGKRISSSCGRVRSAISVPFESLSHGLQSLGVGHDEPLPWPLRTTLRAPVSAAREYTS